MIYRILWSALRLDAATKVGLVDVITLEDHKSALADAQATVEALQRERDKLREATKVICGHCCEPMAVPSKAILQSQLSALQGLVRAYLEARKSIDSDLAEQARENLKHALDATTPATMDAAETHDRMFNHADRHPEAL